MANKYKPHVIVLPEDEANRSIANGFQVNLRPCGARGAAGSSVLGGMPLPRPEPAR
jgi:hypothetical protein